MKKILLLGSGELGKEFVLSVKRLGHHVVAVDSYLNAPAMQVADEYEAIDMLDGNALDSIVEKHAPDIIVPEIEAIRTGRFFDYESKGIQVVPSARAANFTMNRKATRDLAANDLGLKTAKFKYAKSEEDLREAVDEIGLPCVIKPLMSSSGKGQSILRNISEIKKVWEYAVEGSRGDVQEVIVEEFISFDLEITLLTVTTLFGKTYFCPPIGHRQERGDYQESWQPASMDSNYLKEAQVMAKKITSSLTGAGIWGVEFFIAKDGVYFSELSPRPHDTGMVTLGATQNLNEFELHARAILGLPIPEIVLEKSGASAVILANDTGYNPKFEGIGSALKEPSTRVHLFGKWETRINRRMGIMVASSFDKSAAQEMRAKAIAGASKIKVKATIPK